MFISLCACVGVIYSGEYDVSDVTLECISTPGRLKSLPDHCGNRTRDFWDTNALPTELRGQVTNLARQLVEQWTDIPKVAGLIPTVVRQTLQLARCGCTLRVTPQTS